MNKTKTTFSIRAAKNVDTDAVLIYKALYCGGDDFEISIERFLENRLIDASAAHIKINDASKLDRLLLNMCIGNLEPCHLKNVLDDMSDE